MNTLVNVLKKPKVALFPAHPAQLWLMVSIFKEIEQFVSVIWVVRDKDILIDLANKLQLEYVIISKAKTGLFGNAIELLLNIFRAIKITYKYKIDLWVTKYGAGNIAAWICNKQSISFNDDDIDIVPMIAATSYPFAKTIIAPKWVRMGRFEKKTQRYNASNELIYLHPARFTADPKKLSASGINSDKKIILIRLSGLSAHHDVGITGVPENFIDTLIKLYADHYQIMISSEKYLAERFQRYHLKLPVNLAHHLLYCARCVITDSLSMALEAATLGTPSVRLSDFGLQISAFKAVEKYELIYNYAPQETEKALNKIDHILNINEADEFKLRSIKMVSDMEDPLPIFRDIILNSLIDSRP